MEDITHWVVERVSKMPREHQLDIGDESVAACAALHGLASEAIHGPPCGSV
jgi:hypothetical protein